MPLIQTVHPLGKEPDYAQTPRPSVAVRIAERFLPSQEERGADKIGALTFCERSKSAQDTFRRAEVIPKAAPDGQVAIKFSRQGAHFAPPVTGHD
jgi:hypothetical protein